MKINMGSTDRIIRAIVAVILAVLYFTGTATGTLGTILLVVAIVLAFTSLFGLCPLYLPFGISTSSMKKEKE
ncbi:MAG: DUF2892 domain-containing protein [Bacteroidales bacterium]